MRSTVTSTGTNQEEGFGCETLAASRISKEAPALLVFVVSSAASMFWVVFYDS